MKRCLISSNTCLLQQWRPRLQQLVRESDSSTVIFTSIRTSLPIEHWETKRITLVGDAIHSMTPAQGIGGNTALRDASLLCQNLVAASRGEKSLLQAIHDYEVEMVKYGFDAVHRSKQALDGIASENTITRAMFRTGLRAGNTILSLKRR